MTIRQLSAVLERRLAERRMYRIPPDGFITTTEDEYARFEESDPGSAREAPVYRERKKELECSDLCIRGPGRQARLASGWNLRLPQDYLEFCAAFSAYVFAGRSPIQIYGAEDIEETVNGVRDGWDVPKKSPLKLFYFANVIGTTGNFAFHWKDESDRPDVVYAWDYGDVGEPTMDEPGSERFVSDPNFTSWLARLIETDGFPIFPGKRVPTEDGWMKEERVGLVRVEKA